MTITQKINNILNIQLQEIVNVFGLPLSISNIKFLFQKCLLVYKMVYAESLRGAVEKDNIRLNSSSGTNRMKDMGGG